jgi:3',5'-cyclic AMP phosphodiesterase CpdA
LSSEKGFLIAQFSDVHCGDPRFDEKLMLRVVRDVNAAEPDLVIVPGDLTAQGYAEQFEEFARYLELVECPRRIVIAGNHDCRNVGYVLFERVIGPRNLSATFPFASDGEKGAVKVMAVDSNIPDLNDGEVGRDKLALIGEDLGAAGTFRVFMLHHHLVSIPGTGRERNIVWDAGDVLQALRDAGADLVLAGHKHVPYAWPVAGMLVATSGTACTWRTRGYTSPSFNWIRIYDDRVDVVIEDSATGVKERWEMARSAKYELHTVTA